MASLPGAIRSSLGDPWWFIKLLFSVFVLYIVVNEAPKYIPDSNAKLIFWGIMAMLFLGAATVGMYRNINNQTPLFPGLLSIHEIIIKTVGAVIAVLTGTIILIAALYYSSQLPVENTIKYIIYGISVLLITPFIIVPLVLYSARGRIIDAFRLGLIFRAAGNFIVNFIVYIIQFVLIYVILFACIYFFLQQMFSSAAVGLNIIIYFFVIIAFFTSLIYFSDLYDDIIPAIETK